MLVRWLLDVVCCWLVVRSLFFLFLFSFFPLSDGCWLTVNGLALGGRSLVVGGVLWLVFCSLVVDCCAVLCLLLLFGVLFVGCVCWNPVAS